MAEVIFDKYNACQAVANIYADTDQEGRAVDSCLYSGLGFFDKSASYTWEVKEGYKSPVVRFYDRRTHRLAIGLVPMAVKRLREKYPEMRIRVSESMRRVFTPDRTVTRKDIEDFVPGLNLYNREDGCPIVPFDHQYRLVERALNGRRISLLACTSAGKSLSMCIMIRWLMEVEKRRILVIVPSSNLVEQLYSNFVDDYDWAGARDVCTLIYSDSKDKITKKTRDTLSALKIGEETLLRQVTISTWQSLQHKSPSFFERFSAVIVDEAHSAKGEKIRDILSRCVNAVDFKVGLSGTLPDDGLDAGYIESELGRKERIVTLNELVTKGILTPVEVNALIVPYEESCRHIVCKLNYQEEYGAVTNNGARKKCMKWLIDTGRIGKENNVVVLYKNISTLDDMLEYLKANYPQFTYHVIKGNVKAREREAIRHSMEQSSGNILLATYGCMKQGVNIKRLDTAVFAEPAKSPYMVMQSVGRVVRKCRGKSLARVFDIVDDASFRSAPKWGGQGKLNDNYMMKHYRERCSYYSKDSIPVKELRMDGIVTASVDVESIKKKRAAAARKTKDKKSTYGMSGYRPKFGFGQAFLPPGGYGK